MLACAQVRDVYKLGKTLGTGGFSVVKLAVERSSGKQYACKIMSLPDPTKGKKANDPSIRCVAVPSPDPSAWPSRARRLASSPVAWLSLKNLGACTYVPCPPAHMLAARARTS